MKLHVSSNRKLHAWRAFTLVETLIASTCLVIIVASVIACNLYGLSMATRQQIWMGASHDAAKTVGMLMGDIRSAVSLEVGSYSNKVFTQTAGTNQQSGTALMIFTNSTGTVAGGPWILYYYNSTSNNLVRTNLYTTGTGDCQIVSANSITNDSTHPIFTELDFTDTGTAISNRTTLAPISVYLSFTKLQNSQVVIANGSSVDLYQLTTVATPRLLLAQ
jgi:hypothetical protein